MANGIEDIIAEFEAKMKQVSPEDIQMAKGKTPAKAEAVFEPEGEIKKAEAVVEPTGEEPACVNRVFKELVGVLPSLYIGVNIKGPLKEVLETYPECEV